MRIRIASAVAAMIVGLGSLQLLAQIVSPVTFTVFGRASRQPGTYFSASAQIPAGVGSLGISDTMTNAVALNTANSFRLTARISQDGVDWTGPLSRALFVEHWSGGTHFNRFTGQTEANHLRMSWSDSALASGAYTGWFVRAEIDQPVQMSVGFNCVVYPPDFNP